MNDDFDWLTNNIKIPENLWDLIEPTVQGISFLKSSKFKDMSNHVVVLIAITGWLLSCVRKIDEQKFQEIPHPVYMNFSLSVYQKLQQIDEPEYIWNEFVKTVI